MVGVFLTPHRIIGKSENHKLQNIVTKYYTIGFNKSKNLLPFTPQKIQSSVNYAPSPERRD